MVPPDLEAVDLEAVDLEPVDLEPVDLEPVVLEPVDFEAAVDLVRPPALAVLVAPDLAREAAVPVDFEAELPADLVRDLATLAAALVPVPALERAEDFLAPLLLPVLLRPLEDEEPLLPPPLLPVALLERVEPPINRRTASVAAVTMAAPILLALSVAVSAAS